MNIFRTSVLATLVLSWSAYASAVSRSTASPQTQLLLTGCADDAGFSSCQKQANDHLDKCLQDAKANGNTKAEILSCGCTFYTENINCAATSCWNKVNECNYQIFVTGFLANCPVAKAPIPYFPIAAGAQDACSCNLGKIFLETTQAIQESAACSNSAKGGDAGANVQIIQGCICCEISAALSRSVQFGRHRLFLLSIVVCRLTPFSIVGTCPDTDPTLVGLEAAHTLQTNMNTPFNSCGKYLTSFDCVSQLGFQKIGGGQFYTPSNLPAFGKQPLTNTGGVVTTPANGPSFRWTNAADGKTYTINAAGLGKAAQGSGNGGSSSTQGNSDGGGSSSNSKSSASRTDPRLLSWAVGVALFAGAGRICGF